MGMLQVKNLPDDLHAELAARAKAEHTSMSEWVTRLLRRELSRPSVSDWVAIMRARPTDVRDIDSADTIRAGRRETDPDERFDA